MSKARDVLDSLSHRELAELLLAVEQGQKSAEVSLFQETRRQRFREDFWWAYSEVLTPPSRRRYIKNSALHRDMALGVADLSVPLRLWLIPRAHLKTTLLTESHTVWLLTQEEVLLGELMGEPVLRKGHDLRVFIVSETADNAQRMVTNIKAPFRFNDEFRALFPEYCPAERGADMGTRMQFRLRNASDELDEKDMNVDAGGTKTRLTSRHYDWGKLDDLISPQSSETPEALENAKFWLENARYLYDSEDLRHEDVVGTRYDLGDVYGALLDGAKGKGLQDYQARKAYRPYVRSAMERNGRPDSVSGDPIWPQRTSREGLLKEQEDNPYVFSCQRQNQPIPRGKTLFTKELLDAAVIYDLHELPFWDPKTQTVDWKRATIFASMDSARADSKTNDNTVLLLGAFDWNGVLYIMDGYAGKMTADETLDATFTVCDQHRVLKFAIERTGGQHLWEPLIIRDPRYRGKGSGEWEGKRVHVALDMQERVSTVSKVLRAEGIVPFLKEGMLKLVYPLLQRPVVRAGGTVFDLIYHEMLAFPSTGITDDTVDCVADLCLVGFRASDPNRKKRQLGRAYATHTGSQ